MNPLDDIGCISANVHPAAFDTMYENSQLRYVMLEYVSLSEDKIQQAKNAHYPPNKRYYHCDFITW
ncbi:MAG: hypothetical protein WAM14_05090 [Candidatus Nitrosopolaris sp.]